MSQISLIAWSAAEGARKRGFEVPDWDQNLPAKLIFAIGELDEAVEATEFQYTNVDVFAEELADVCLRLLGVLHEISDEGKNWCPDRIAERHVEKPSMAFVPVEKLLWPALRYIIKAAECWRTNGPQSKSDAIINLELAVLAVFRVSDRLGIDLVAACDRKLAQNDKRPRYHGKGRTI